MATQRLARFVYILLWCILAWAIWSVLGPVLSPVISSLVIAYFLAPVIDKLAARGVPRIVGIILTFFIMSAGVLGFFAILVPELLGEVRRAVVELPTWLDANWKDIKANLDMRLHTDVEPQIRNILGGLLEQARETVLAVFSALFTSMGSLLNAVLIPVLTTYFLLDWEGVKRKPLQFVPERFKPWVLDRAKRMDDVVANWVRGQVKVSLILAVLYAFGLIVLQVHMGWLIGTFAGAINIVPYLGFAVGIAMALIMAAVYGSPGQIIGVIGVFALVQFLEGNFITPKLVGEAVGMSALTVIIVIIVGSSLFGFAGMILSVPAWAAFGVLWPDIQAWYQNQPWFRGITSETRPVDS